MDSPVNLALVTRKRGRAAKPRASAAVVGSVGPAPSADTTQQEQKRQPRMTLNQAKEELKTLARALVTVDEKTLPELIKKIQRLRVVIHLLREADAAESDPATNRDLSLLSRLLTGKDLGAGGLDPEEAAEREARAEAVLRDRGIAPGAASRILRVIQSVLGAEAHGDGRPPDPGADA